MSGRFGEPWHGVDDVIETVYGRVPEIEARRQELRERAIACVNACAGLDDPATAISELVRAAETVVAADTAAVEELRANGITEEEIAAMQSLALATRLRAALAPFKGGERG